MTEPAVPDVDLLAATLRADLDDLDVFVEVLASKLEESLPGMVAVERGGGGLFGRGQKRVESVAVSLGDRQFTLTRRGRSVRTEVVHAVRGVRLSGDEVPADEWLSQLAQEMAAYAQRNATARSAIERLLG